MANRYPKFRNDRAVPEIRIGVREFNCIGVSPPRDHPHVYITMGRQRTSLCPYCATRYRDDSQLVPFEALNWCRSKLTHRTACSSIPTEFKRSVA